jgi:Protein of unknown function (DUF3667)
VEPRETVWHFITHFFNDITHFDGKFFSTGRLLLTRPGFLSKEYIQGRRSDYLHPIRLYIFSSAIFFLLFFSVVNVDSMVENKNAKDSTEVTGLSASAVALRLNQQKMKDSVSRTAFLSAATKLDEEASALQAELIQRRKKADSLRQARAKNSDDEEIATTNDGKFRIKSDQSINSYPTTHAYELVQSALPAEKRDGWFARRFKRRMINLKEGFTKNSEGTFSYILEHFFHTLPQALILSLPITAFLLFILYARRKKFYYVDHAVFVIHLYCANFIGLLAIFAIFKLDALTSWGWLWIVEILLALGMLIYSFLAMKVFYQQSGAKTFLKFSLLSFASFLMLSLVSSAFLFLSMLQYH